MSWLRVLDIHFHILASLLYSSTRHLLLGGTNMPPRAPRVRGGPETRGTTTRHTTSAAGAATQLSGPPGPYGTPGSPGVATAILSSSGSMAQELLKHASKRRVEGGCCLAL